MTWNEQNIAYLPVDKSWTGGCNKDLKMHRIHKYPAKFSPFIVERSLQLLKKRKKEIKVVADVFCGCGTTALETKRLGLGFWGCDINPVATLITKVKTSTYSEDKLREYFREIMALYNLDKKNCSLECINPRIKYWFDEKTMLELIALQRAIENKVMEKKYNDFFICCFSNILKETSRWLAKSIKPQIDPKKIPASVEKQFSKQFKYMLGASTQLVESIPKNSPEPHIHTGNFLEINFERPFVDLIITSPPYVTSYEYADIHQLSTLWLGFSENYRELREGTIGSVHKKLEAPKQPIVLAEYEKTIITRLEKKDPRRANSIRRYFQDMRRSIEKMYAMLKAGGAAVIIIGNTKYRGVYVNNAKCISNYLKESGFIQIQIRKRRIMGKTLTPYRDNIGRFSKNKRIKVYRHEFIVSAEKEITGIRGCRS
ncbi:SAM-dependent methyltransferase [Candidatus Micrarchaeota archaeon CG10_big_fil_rev_8_21_14_0_10_45_29]|nr:MAG: SAM-dependent methyltransferase [Candidatus Micrarchaeota archaeon CG10_big_fil_rev_8_21_14_0_10_45_29]